MSLSDLLKETAVHQEKMHAELRRRIEKAEREEARDNIRGPGGGPGYEAYDEWKADAYEDAVDRLDILLEVFAKEEPGIILRFGDGADADTFNDVFQHLARGFVIEVNGADMVCNTTGGDRTVGLYGLAWSSPDFEFGDPDQPVGVPWEELESVTIY